MKCQRDRPFIKEILEPDEPSCSSGSTNAGIGSPT
jgi:hypothetical protein